MADQIKESAHVKGIEALLEASVVKTSTANTNFVLLN